MWHFGSPIIMIIRSGGAGLAAGGLLNPGANHSPSTGDRLPAEKFSTLKFFMTHENSVWI
jgi:hypothetical protein